jgi:hypothetical protein
MYFAEWGFSEVTKHPSDSNTATKMGRSQHSRAGLQVEILCRAEEDQ